MSPELIRAKAIEKARKQFAEDTEAARKCGNYQLWAMALYRHQWAIDDANRDYWLAVRRVAA